MNLKKLEISGFKSFVNHTELDFTGGITAVLGPNGCGKTNIVDSIRWVLGEQKTRMLRNTKMENVIFNGTKLRKPLGMAEVHMTLSNEDHGMPLDYNEVKLSRKLFRDGTSEYYVNGEIARLKDIKSLLVDTGLGSHTYSIIEREMVDAVISEKEQDKRDLLEEAAGIIRYRMQREEALRKIKHTEIDLTRLTDILVELEKEIRSLRYQMGKARRYSRLKEQVDRMEAALIKRSLYELLEKSDAVKAEREHHEGIRLADNNEITLLENQLSEARIRGAEFERRLQDLYENRHKLSQSLQQHEEKIAILSERITSATNRIAEDDEEIARSKTKLVSLAAELNDFRGAIQGKDSDYKRRHDDLLREEESLRGVSRELEALKARLRDKKQLVLDLVREKERKRGMREHLDSRASELAETCRNAENQRGNLATEERRLEDVRNEVRRAIEEKRGSIGDINSTLDRLTAKSAQAMELLAACEDRYGRSVVERARLGEKQEYLERIKNEHSRQNKEIFAKNDKIRGVVADHVRVDKKYRRCFEACLAPVLQAVLVESKEDAFGCLNDLRALGSGRIQLIYPHRNGGPVPDLPPGNVLGSALDFLGGDGDVASYLKPYLADVAVTRNVEDALDVVAGHPGARVATLDGVFFDGHGRILVASSEDIDVTLLELDTKLRELGDAIARADSRSRELQARKTALTALKNEVTETVAERRAKLREEEIERERLVEEQGRHDIELAKIREKITLLTNTIAESQKAAEDIRRRLEAEPEAPSAVEDVQTTDEELTRMEHDAVELERRKEALAEVAGRMKLDVATIKGEIATAMEKCRNLEMLEGELKELITSREQDIVRCRGEIESADSSILQSRGEIKTFHERVDGFEKEIDGAKEQHGVVAEQCARLEKELRELKDRREQKKQNLERCNLELATIDAKISGLLDKAMENFHQDLAPFVGSRDRFEPSEWESLDQGDLAELRAKVEMFGPVNMLALEEYNEKKERFDFLTAQKNDLEEAKETLVQAIRRINKEARRRLSETFELVRANFKKTFLTLFDGGEADLFFAESDDPLEAKIKIVASPKGKRLHDISSLSGGERALVALSLLFAIYLVKPSPFCVFDEVDAPLDDANIGRFVRMLKSFTDKTQFIVITHNKRTMEAANFLYGVTMEEAGVSRLISVHIGEVDRFKDHPGRRPERKRDLPSEEEVSVSP